MKQKNYLKSFLAGESKAYGFTIAFWGSGAILINTFGIPSFTEILYYATGAVTGYGILALIAFNNALSNVEINQSTSLVLSMIHYIAAIIPILTAKIISLNIENSSTAFLLTGMSVSIVYNSLSVLEEDIAELIS
jgi:hypothetical protein